MIFNGMNDSSFDHAQGNSMVQDQFAFLYANYGKNVYNLAYRMTGNSEDAADIAQETFLQVNLHLDSFRGDSQITTWIYSITRHLCYQHYSKKDKLSFATIEAAINSSSSICTTDEITASEKLFLIDQIKDGCLIGLIRCLPFNQRIAFILHILLHLSIKDTACILNKSEGNTKVMVYRARNSLKNFLCSHCSLYDPGNSCHCENLIGYSLKNHLVSLDLGKDGDAISPEEIQADIYQLQDTVELYQSLGEHPIPGQLQRNLQEMIAQRRLGIFQ
jgi:RNA polymerase sigma factor (sigma-70 family)